MRILTLGGKMLSDPLRDRGHEVLSMGPPGTVLHVLDRETDFLRSPEEARAAIRESAESFNPDWILQVDDSNPLPHLGLESLPVPKAWYAVDSHLHWEWHRHYAPVFDLVFCAQQNRVPALSVFRGKVEWLPLAFTDEPVFLPWSGREHDASFVGTLDPALNPARIALLDGLRSLGRPVHAVQGSTKPVYSASRLVINQSAHDDLNFRVFEAMGYGALLVTDRISHSLGEIAEPEKDFLVYAPGDAADLHAKVEWALGHPSEAEAMARRGHAKVSARHMMSHRIDRIAEVMAGPLPIPSPRGHVLAHLAAAHEHLSRLALPGPLVEFFAAEARRHASAALDASPGEPYALLTLAQLDLEQGAHGPALAWLETDGAGEGGEGYRQRYAFLKALLLAHAGRMAEARQTVLAGLRAFPLDADLLKLAAAVGR
ncbi:MAG: uncharacterized protein JWO30_2284 [Fibrobacteres bacterium]|nr:uncharacterized protein [Fibrobacterota bacterium]